MSIKKIRTTDILKAKNQKKLVCTTCYDSIFAKVLQDSSSLDLVLVGDSLGHIVQGHHTTLDVTLENIIYHTKCVKNSLKTPLLVSDMPFLGMSTDTATLFENCQKILVAGAEAIKIEGHHPHLCEQISLLTGYGVPVMGHLGLTPQHIHSLGGYKKQGKTPKSSEILIDAAKRLEDAGCFGIVLELIDFEVSQKITESISIPTIGIGSGPCCDGQILVLHDLLGMNTEFTPSFLKLYETLHLKIDTALKTFAHEVQNETFPPKP